jgi:rod shape-determining protein MreD
MTLLLAAVGATATALLELTVGPYLRVATTQPHLVLVFGVITTIAIGFEAGLAWGFMGGLALDVLAQRPLGSTAFALLLSAGGAFVLTRLGGRFRVVLAIPAAFVLSLLYSMTLFLTFNALRATIPVADPASTIVPGAVYDAVIAGLVGPLLITLHDRRLDVERVDW